MKGDPCRHCGAIVKRYNGLQCYSCSAKLQPCWATPISKRLKCLRAGLWQHANADRHAWNQRRGRYSRKLMAHGSSREHAEAVAWEKFPVYQREQACESSSLAAQSAASPASPST